MKVLAEKLTDLILESLAIFREDLNWDVGSPSTALQLNSYPPCPNPNRAMGLAPHTDTSFLTILYQGSISGLQIFKQGAGWISMLPVTGALVVNVGDLLHILTNARFPSVLHRAVLNQEGSHRLSVAYFFGLPIECSVSPLLKLLDSGENPRYRPVTVKEYVDIKSKYFEEPLTSIRI
ncbi:hypothetical protein Goshw_026100 [Gossypium schwendimanii]|uniref:Fe2OG dioxygenase domain-containing protein n=1 Tax=Gossypium schwendimanii TaxID=34291 RepID=A0A7J9KNK9_GOSSC|nr:hypothetical protein [Gossypium schwendimanii]